MLGVLGDWCLVTGDWCLYMALQEAEIRDKQDADEEEDLDGERGLAEARAADAAEFASKNQAKVSSPGNQSVIQTQRPQSCP